jgi:hypothetical protein
MMTPLAVGAHVSVFVKPLLASAEPYGRKEQQSGTIVLVAA